MIFNPHLKVVSSIHIDEDVCCLESHEDISSLPWWVSVVMFSRCSVLHSTFSPATAILQGAVLGGYSHPTRNPGLVNRTKSAWHNSQVKERPTVLRLPCEMWVTRIFKCSAWLWHFVPLQLSWWWSETLFGWCDGNCKLNGFDKFSNNV